jgi:Rab5 GDP/GTP exchange factor
MSEPGGARDELIEGDNELVKTEGTAPGGGDQPATNASCPGSTGPEPQQAHRNDPDCAPPPTNPKLVTAGELRAENAAGTDDLAASSGLSDRVTAADSERVRAIEQEASEHLARRAAEMQIDASGSQGGSRDTAASKSSVPGKHDLPASPPPPAPPEKDKGKAPVEAETEYDEKHQPGDDVAAEVPEAPQDDAETTGLEIQTIMDQFAQGGLGEQEIMSPRLERQQPVLVLPPRSSSLEHALSPQTTGQSMASQRSMDRASLPPTSPGANVHDDNESVTSTKTGSIFQPPPPSSEPEQSLPFDFHRFLEQLRHRTADPVARFLRSFLGEFGKKQWMVHEQVKIIGDFLEFISKKMAQCEVWRTVSDAEFDNAKEGMEKLVMNRLYSQTFSPAIPAPAGSPRKGARGGHLQADAASPHGPGRRGQHQEDVERDDVIAQKMRIYGWIAEEHLDIKPIGEKGRKFLGLAQQELLKINSYRAPRDKVICVLNSCKVIFGFLKSAKADQSADAFVPLLIYTVLRARPEHLVSNVQYIWRFRNQDKLGGEAGYYMSSLMGVVSFIENLDRTNLTISDEDFEKNVEQAVSAIAEENKEQEYENKTHAAAAVRPSLQNLSEKSALSRPEVTPRNSMDAERSSPRRNVSQRVSEKSQQSTNEKEEDNDFDSVTGLLRTIQKPLSSIGRIFSDDGGGSQSQTGLKPAGTPQPGSTPRRLSPAPNLLQRPSAEDQRRSNERQRSQQRGAEDAAARQANAEAAEARRVRVREHKVVVE